MSHHGRGRGRGRGRGGPPSDFEEPHRPSAVKCAHVLSVFQSARTELDDKHDRYERIVKLSRDVTIESKRIIFALHRYTVEPNKEVVLEEARRRLKELKEARWKAIAVELKDSDQHHYIRAHSPGLQEYIEAMSLLRYLTSGDLLPYTDVVEDLKFTVKKVEEEAEQVEEVSILVPVSEYLLGVSDVSGELMRLSLNALTNGDLKTPGLVMDFLRDLASGFARVRPNLHGKDAAFKDRVLQQNLAKVERSCYTLALRSTEVPAEFLSTAVAMALRSQPTRYDEVEGMA